MKHRNVVQAVSIAMAVVLLGCNTVFASTIAQMRENAQARLAAGGGSINFQGTPTAARPAVEAFIANHPGLWESTSPESGRPGQTAIPSLSLPQRVTVPGQQPAQANLPQADAGFSYILITDQGIPGNAAEVSRIPTAYMPGYQYVVCRGQVYEYSPVRQRYERSTGDVEILGERISRVAVEGRVEAYSVPVVDRLPSSANRMQVVVYRDSVYQYDGTKWVAIGAIK